MVCGRIDAAKKCKKKNIYSSFYFIKYLEERGVEGKGKNLFVSSLWFVRAKNNLLEFIL